MVVWGHSYPVSENNEGSSRSCKICKSWTAFHLCCHSVCDLSANSSMIVRGQVTEGPLIFHSHFLLVALLGSLTGELPCQFVNSSISVFCACTWGIGSIGSNQQFWLIWVPKRYSVNKKVPSRKVPIASSFSFTSPQGCALAVWQSLSIHFSSHSTGDLSQPWTITLS